MSLNVINVKVAYHEWAKTYTKISIGWEGSHPIVYMAKGSHALYKNFFGENHYLSLWSINKTKTFKCPKYCKTIGITYPCGLKDCQYGFTSSGSFYDSTGNANKYTGRFRLIASNFLTIDSSSLSQDEKNLLVFQGRFGEKIQNNGWSTFENSVNTTLSPLYAICSDCKSTVKGGLDSASAEYASDAPTSLATKAWWKQ